MRSNIVPRFVIFHEKSMTHKTRMDLFPSTDFDNTMHTRFTTRGSFQYKDVVPPC